MLKRVDLIVVNAVFGAAMTGGYAAVLQLSMLARSLGRSASSVLKPIIFRKYAQGDVVRLRILAAQAVKLLGLALALPVGLLCGFSRPLLSIWLGPDIATSQLHLILICLVAHLGVTLSTLPLAFLHTAYAKVRCPGVVTVVSGIINLGLAIAVAVWGQWGAVGVAMAGSVVWTAKNALFTPVYSAYIMNLPWRTFFPSPVSVACVTVEITKIDGQFRG